MYHTNIQLDKEAHQLCNKLTSKEKRKRYMTLMKHKNYFGNYA